MAKIRKVDAHYQSGPKKGKLKAGYYYDVDGILKKAKAVVRTKLYKAAKALGSAGGKAKAKRQFKLF